MAKMLTLEQTAEFMCVSTMTVRRLFKNGDLKGYKVGKLWRTTEDDILLYLNRPKIAKEPVKRTRTRRASQFDLGEPMPIKYVNGRPHYV